MAISFVVASRVNGHSHQLLLSQNVSKQKYVNKVKFSQPRFRERTTVFVFAVVVVVVVAVVIVVVVLLLLLLCLSEPVQKKLKQSTSWSIL